MCLMQCSMYDRVMAHLDQASSLRQVSLGSGVAYSTLTRIARRDTKAPSVHDFDALLQYFQKKTNGRRKTG